MNKILSIGVTALAVLLIAGEVHAISLEQPGHLAAAVSSDNTENSNNYSIGPLVKITYPPYPPTLNTGRITIEGTVDDHGIGVKKVSAKAHTFPFGGDYDVRLADQPLPISSYNWSQWSLPLMINTTGTYRVVIEVTDNFGNVGHAETTINAASPAKITKTATNSTSENAKSKIAFVRPTFTEAAYQENGFHRFYEKYGFPPLGVNVTTDLQMLTVKTPLSIPELQDDYDLQRLSNLTVLIPSNGTGLDDISFGGYPDHQPFWMPFVAGVEKVAPDAAITVIRDEDVHDGNIFVDNSNNTNAFDALLLFHEEYVTQSMYDNYRKFVENGGTIVFVDSNVLYAEVRFDRDNDRITYIDGHDWKFDGKVATKSQPERWFNDTKEWVGGNWLINFIDNKITFANNPFNYTHFKEQYVNNPEARTIVDYGIRIPPLDIMENPQLANSTVATYALNHGQGKVIMIGLFGENMSDNEAFLKFFEKLLRDEVFV